jgi:mono/diheme cytochrome c family protein
MRKLLLLACGAAIAFAALGVSGVVYLRRSGLDSRSQPGAGEVRLARFARRLAIPAAIRERRNPAAAPLATALATLPEATAEGMAHFADHCASCHANDGSGDTELGRGLYPRAPDMRAAATQDLSDGELFHVIEHGIRFTGMPAWSTGTAAGEAATWRLVLFIRHLPRLTAPELETMKGLNPRSVDEVRQEIEEERFLNQGVQP